MSPKLRKAALFATTLALLLCLGSTYYRWLYPFGHRVGCMPLMMGALAYYAQEHEGWYPKDGRSPLQCLEVFYPKYLGAELAGLSGDRTEVLRRLKSAQPLDETVSSWVYHPGFKLNDDPRLALIWERREGVTVNGHREDGHVVGFVDGNVRQISARDWLDFLEEQKRLRQSVLALRGK